MIDSTQLHAPSGASCWLKKDGANQPWTLETGPQHFLFQDFGALLTFFVVGAWLLRLRMSVCQYRRLTVDCNCHRPQKMHFRPFSYEHPTTGLRQFAVSTLPYFWQHYSSLVPSQRHYYEILRENTPCRCYLDLEFSVPVNPDTDGDALTTELLQVCGAIAILFRWGEPVVVDKRQNFLVLPWTIDNIPCRS